MFLLTGPTQKSSKYGTEKITKYTGPTQDKDKDKDIEKDTIYA